MVHSSTKRILLSEALRSIFPDFCEVGKIDDGTFGGWLEKGWEPCRVIFIG